MFAQIFDRSLASREDYTDVSPSVFPYCRFPHGDTIIRRFLFVTASIAAGMTVLHGSLALWRLATGDLAGSSFGVLASQRDVESILGLCLPFAALVEPR